MVVGEGLGERMVMADTFSGLLKGGHTAARAALQRICPLHTRVRVCAGVKAGAPEGRWYCNYQSDCAGAESRR